VIAKNVERVSENGVQYQVPSTVPSVRGPFTIATPESERPARVPSVVEASNPRSTTLVP